MLRARLAVLVIVSVVYSAAWASSLTPPQIEKSLVDLEVCIRTMCVPANDAAMSLSWARDLRAKLAQQPSALDQWVIGRLDPVITLLAQKKLPAALERTQAAVAGLVRPRILKSLQDLEVCVRTMCLPSGNATMGIGEADKVLKELAKYPGAFSQWLTQRLNAVVLLLKQKKVKEGLDQLQLTIRELPNP